MALKRKLSMDFDDNVSGTTAKQPRLIPFPNSDIMDMDVDMSDSSVLDLTPLSIPMQPFHTRLSSNASTASSTSDSPRDSPFYPAFDLYPHEENDGMTCDNLEQVSKQVGLLQPKGPMFTHHGASCSQIPKLRMACSSGPSGRRTMWAHCEQCGAIEMVDTD